MIGQMAMAAAQNDIIKELKAENAKLRDQLVNMRAALETLLKEAEGFSVSGVYFNEECMGHKGPAMAHAVLDALSDDSQFVRARPARERVAETIGWYLAGTVAENNQPDMSGDPRKRIPTGKRRQFDDACLACADAILSLSDEIGK